MTRVLHVCTDLVPNGAQRMLVRLLAALDPERFSCAVVSLRDEGPLATGIRDLGVAVHALRLGWRPADPWRAARLVRIVRGFSPDVTHTWLGHANLLGGCAARLAGRGKVLWSLRHGALERGTASPATRLVARVCAALAPRVPDHVVCCAGAVLEAHVAAGYPRERMSVLPNGVDLDLFRPDPAARASVRAELGIAPDAPLVAMVARLHPVKDHATFVAAAARAARALPDVRFVLCGAGISPDDAPLAAAIDAAGIRARCTLLPERRDVARLLAASDVVTLSSRSEGFPNVLAEAMACGVPCVATDVGAVRELVGETGCVVPPGDPEALAGAWCALVRASRVERACLGAAARRRVAERFSLAEVTRGYADLYESLAHGAPVPLPARLAAALGR